MVILAWSVVQASMDQFVVWVEAPRRKRMGVSVCRMGYNYQGKFPAVAVTLQHANI